MYLNSLKCLFENQVEFDWIVNLSGQCYPTQPLATFKQFLSETQYDRFLEYRDVPEESFMQPLLANSNIFKLCDKNYFYMDWHNSKHGRPRILTKEDHDFLITSKDFYFARKFDPTVDNEILDCLDKHILG